MQPTDIDAVKSVLEAIETAVFMAETDCENENVIEELEKEVREFSNSFSRPVIDKEFEKLAAKSILNYMGNSQFLTMVGGKVESLKTEHNCDVTLTFSFKMCSKANRLEICLNRGKDLFTFTLYKMVKGVKKVHYTVF